MKFRKELLVLPFLLILSCCIKAQPSYFGGHPVQQKWEKIQSASTNIFFPKGWGRPAQLVAGYIHQFDSLSLPTSLGKQSVKANIVLQPFSTVSNGYVAYGPFKSEFYLTGNPDIYSQSSNDWLQQLSYHEYRHVQQFRAFRKYPLPKLFYVLLGEFGLDFYSNMVIPDYFWEGDAVYHETRFTNAGRGRTHNFYNPFRVIFENNKQYTWMQWRNGSMRKNIPNHYALGYLLASYGYEKYGDDFWKNITGSALNLKGLFYPFQNAFKSNYQISYKQFTKDAFQHFESEFNKKDPVSSDLFRSNQYWSYWINDKEYIYLESSYKKLPRFFIKNTSTGEVRTLQYQWISNERQFHYNNDHIVYTNYDVNSRWHWTTWQDIVLYDLNSATQKQITHKGKYFQPAVNEKADKIVAIYQNADMNNLHLLKKETNGEWQAEEISNKEAFTYHHPRIYGDNIYAIVHDKQSRMSIARITDEGQHQLLFEPVFAQIGNFVISNDTVFCNMNYEGRDRLFAFNNNRFYLLDNNHPTTTCYFFDQKNGRFVYSDYQLPGLTIQIADADSFQWEYIEKDYWQKHENYFHLASLNQQPISAVNTDPLPVKKVSPIGSPFKVYSWLATPESEDEISVSIEAANIINNLYAHAGYNYNTTNRISKINTGITMGVLFTRLSLNYQRQGRSEIAVLRADSSATLTGYTQDELSLSAAVPLTWYRHRNIKTLSVQSIFSRVAFNNTSARTRTDYNSFKLITQYRSYIPPAQNNIQTRWGYSLLGRLDYNWGNVKANRYALVGTMFLPGVSANHAFDFSLSHQNSDKTNQIALSEYITLSRGFRQVFVHQLNKFSSNYHLPLVYPDWGFGNIVFLQRLRTQLFYDASTYKYYYTNQQGNTRLSGNAVSAGAWLWLDGKIWNQYKLSLGFRYAHALQNEFKLPFEQFVVSLPINF